MKAAGADHPSAAGAVAVPGTEHMGIWTLRSLPCTSMLPGFKEKSNGARLGCAKLQTRLWQG